MPNESENREDNGFLFKTVICKIAESILKMIFRAHVWLLNATMWARKPCRCGVRLFVCFSPSLPLSLSVFLSFSICLYFFLSLTHDFFLGVGGVSPATHFFYPPLPTRLSQCLFFILRNTHITNAIRKVHSYGPSDYFGELALLEVVEIAPSSFFFFSLPQSFSLICDNRFITLVIS
jgi:hypothetical protein